MRLKTTREVELRSQVEIENEETTPCHLPGCILPSVSNEHGLFMVPLPKCAR